jgi:hypothetical protein
MEIMTKKRTSLNVDDQLWKDWTLHVHKKTGSAYKVSEETERIIREEMKNHPVEG